MEDQEKQEQDCILQYLSSPVLLICSGSMLGTGTVSQIPCAVSPLGNSNTRTGLVMSFLCLALLG